MNFLQEWEDLSKIESSKTTKTVLKVQPELYRQLVLGIPTSNQLEGMKKYELVDLLVNAINLFFFHQIYCATGIPSYVTH